MMEILATGPLATIQDRGRFGYRALGVPRSGAADQAALALGNRLLGNEPTAAAVEVTLGGLSVLLRDAATIAVTGAVCPSTLAWGTAITLPAGRRLALGTPPAGLRSYVCIRGGIDAARVLGSCSTDLLSGLGPPPLKAGDVLSVGPPPPAHVSGVEAVARPTGRPLQLVLGPRADWFTDEAVAALTAGTWTIRPDSDRIGIRLAGQPLTRRRSGELDSEPMLPGAIQVPPDGQPIILGWDGPVTGGYPVIAVVHSSDLDLLAQVRPGDTVQFTPKLRVRA